MKVQLKSNCRKEKEAHLFKDHSILDVIDKN